MRWQKRARLGLAIFAIVFAAVVYSAIGERVTPKPPVPPERLDPKATIESSRGILNRITGAKLDFVITFDRQLAYENGVSKLMGVRIEVKEKQGRDFVITSGEGQAGERQQDLRLSGNVKMAASDGFVLSTETATFNQTEGIVRTPGQVSFSKGTMTGGGIGMTYDNNTDVLTILQQARVTMTDDGGNTTGEFTAGKATLARQEDYLLLDASMHALRGEQTIEADRGRANLTEDEKAITAIELRGNARVAGGSAGFDSMSARDIDLTYAPGGQVIERVALSGGGAIALKAADGSPGQQMHGESLVLALAPDGAVTSATGRENVQLDLPASGDSSSRQVKARTLDASGESGKGMTSARFTDDVEYREEASGKGGPRTARARALTVGLEGGAVTRALFTGHVQFEEQALRASAAQASYEPTKGVLQMTRGGAASPDTGEGRPRVADDQIEIEGDSIDLTLEGRRMRADGSVRTVLQAKAKTPGLLKQGQPVNVSASTLDYSGTPARAVYSGAAQLWQGDTAIRGDRIMIDQEKGNLTVTGNARSTLPLGDTSSLGRAEEIRYEDATRQITYTGKIPPVGTAIPPPTREPDSAPTRAAPTAPTREAESAPTREAEIAPTGAPKPPVPAFVPAQLSGPQGDLRAGRIVVFLAPAESRMDRLEAFTNVTLRLDDRLATGTRLTYHAPDERYVMDGTPAAPVKVVEACRETMGSTLTFFKSADRIIVDGNEEIRTQTKAGGRCSAPAQR